MQKMKGSHISNSGWANVVWGHPERKEMLAVNNGAVNISRSPVNTRKPALKLMGGLLHLLCLVLRYRI
jgi:hypothetical protein